MDKQLSSLKAGDAVGVYGSHLSLPRRDTITEITAGGNFRVSERIYTKHGNRRGGKAWSREFIRPWDQESYDDSERENKLRSMRNEIRSANWEKVPDSTVDDIHTTLSKCGAIIGSKYPI